MGWVLKLASGEATTGDVEALNHWRSESPEHREAFAEAKLLWEVLGPSSNAVAQRMLGASTAHSSKSDRLLGRRAVLGGALAASTAAIGYVGSAPPFRLWPSLDELRADYRTGTGEQRQVALADNVSLVLNTQTSVGLQPASRGRQAIELISGEAAVTIDASNRGPFDVIAANGKTMTTAARFNVRRDETTVQVTCLDGVVNVQQHKNAVTLPTGHQVTYGAEGLGEVLQIDVAAATAWEHGQLIFRHETLAHVIEEVNRYRPGRIILLNEELAKRDVVATFYLDRIDDTVEHLALAFGARTRVLPGGVVLLS